MCNLVARSCRRMIYLWLSGDVFVGELVASIVRYSAAWVRVDLGAPSIPQRQVRRQPGGVEDSHRESQGPRPPPCIIRIVRVWIADMALSCPCHRRLWSACCRIGRVRSPQPSCPARGWSSRPTATPSAGWWSTWTDSPRKWCRSWTSPLRFRSCTSWTITWSPSNRRTPSRRYQWVLLCLYIQNSGSNTTALNRGVILGTKKRSQHVFSESK